MGAISYVLMKFEVIHQIFLAGMKIILLSGWSGSGKDTVADYLVARHNYKKFAFASPLKDLASELYTFPRELADSQEGKRQLWRVGYSEKTIRQILLDVARIDKSRFGDDIYAIETMGHISKESPDSNIVISDTRYLNEIRVILDFAIKEKHEFAVWRISRTDKTTSPVDDVSEHVLDTYRADVYISNPGDSLENLYAIVEDVLSDS
jgi:tRNA uridine 5-carbamoylmethylation protein Kti12